MMKKTLVAGLGFAAVAVFAFAGSFAMGGHCPKGSTCGLSGVSCEYYHCGSGNSCSCQALLGDCACQIDSACEPDDLGGCL